MLHGTRVDGTWTLVPAAMDGDPKNWLLLRKRDDSPAPRRNDRTAYAPMLATPSEALPKGNGWLYEVKWDGYRAICLMREGEATLSSRAGNDLTGRFDAVARALPRALRTPACVVDGEVCALDDEGRPSFAAMQQGAGTLVVYLFDLLEVEGTPVLDLPLTERRERLRELVDASKRHRASLGDVRGRRPPDGCREGAGSRGSAGQTCRCRTTSRANAPGTGSR